MKLTWRDIVTTLLALAGGAVVYAKYYSYSWSFIGSWRSAAAVLALAGVLLFAFNSFSFANRSILNITEMVLGSVAIVLALIGMFVVNHAVFYGLAATLGTLWLLDTARHARHSFIGDEGMGTTNFHHHAPVH